LPPWKHICPRLRAAWRAAAAAWSNTNPEQQPPADAAAGQQHQQQSEVLRAITEAIPSTVVVVDSLGRYRFANSAFERYVGRSADQILGHTAEEVLGAGEVARRRPFMAKAFAGESVDFTLEYPGEQGVHYRAMSCIPLKLNGAIDGIVGISQDVTPQRREQERLRALFDLSPVGIALWDLDTGRLLEVNDALVAPSGYTREELLQRTSWDLTPESSMAAAHERQRQLRQFGRFGPMERDYLRKDGTTYPALIAGTAVRDPDGRTVVWSISQDISQRKALEFSLAEAARLDKLTGLANRAVLMERLQLAIERVQQGTQSRFAVLFLDFDRFKLLNDTMGHDAGDDLLRQIAERLRRSMRATDVMSHAQDGNVVARFGGDEFVILINDLEQQDDAVRISERLLLQLRPAYAIKGRITHSTASIGIVLGDQSAESAEAIVRNADVAMYEAKRAGRARSVIFNDAMHQRLTRQVQIEHDLREAISSSQLWMAYQPIVDLETGRMVSAEALVRWTHPTLGELTPADFISIAEESGLIVQIGAWVVEDVCRQMAEWRRTVPGNALRTISINLSRAELALGDQLFDRIMGALHRHAVPPELLQLEVTEYEVIRDPVAARKLMELLRSAGVRLAIDDFGTGTSSLACLREYPFDTVKIAREFLTGMIEEPDAYAVLHATTSLVRNLGKVCVAEGVEDAAQVSVLQSLGCQFAQGYLFGRPVPAHELFTGGLQ
jgi:diguanylate cyclase (GGDEF)-like protein/PAS domain S-box-containing protein